MRKKLSLRDKIIKMYKRNDTAGIIYDLIKGKSEEDKRKAMDIFVDLASIENTDRKLRTKALAIVTFFKDMCGEKDVGGYYEDGFIIREYQDRAKKIIEDNCCEIIKKAGLIENLETDFEWYDFICETVCCLHSYPVNTKIIKTLFSLLEEKLNLKEKAKIGNMTSRDMHIYDQIPRIKKLRRIK